MKLPIAFLVMMGAIKADGIRPPPSANADADADDSPVLRTSGPTSTSTTTAADDEDEAHPKTRQTEGYADLIASATKPGLSGSGRFGECFSRRRLLPSGRTGTGIPKYRQSHKSTAAATKSAKIFVRFSPARSRKKGRLAPPMTGLARLMS